MNVWAVVPVKPFSQAKQRLADVLQDWERVVLSRLMLRDTLQSLAQVPGLAGRLVVTADPGAAMLARGLGADVLPECLPLGLNAAVTLAARAVQLRSGDAVLVVPADVPGLSAKELQQLIKAHAACHAAGGVLSLVPAHDRDGTNAWLLSPPGALASAFGPGSFLRHQQQAQAVGLTVLCQSMPGVGLDLDLDLARDLERFVAEPRWCNTCTARFLRARRHRLTTHSDAQAA